jgi:hypothetical protein
MLSDAESPSPALHHTELWSLAGGTSPHRRETCRAPRPHPAALPRRVPRRSPRAARRVCWRLIRPRPHRCELSTCPHGHRRSFHVHLDPMRLAVTVGGYRFEADEVLAGKLAGDARENVYAVADNPEARAASDAGQVVSAIGHQPLVIGSRQGRRFPRLDVQTLRIDMHGVQRHARSGRGVAEARDRPRPRAPRRIAGLAPVDAIPLLQGLP